MIIEPNAKWIKPAIIQDVRATLNPWVAASPARTPTKAKLVPCIIGKRDPTGPTPMVWKRVAIPAKSMAIWIM